MSAEALAREIAVHLYMQGHYLSTETESDIAEMIARLGHVSDR